MTKTVEAWCCGIAADHELGETNIEIYASEEACFADNKCAQNDPKRCAPRKLKVTFDTSWLTEEEMKKQEAGDPRLQAVKNVLGVLTDQGGKIFSPIRVDEISKTILFWIDEAS